MSGLLGKIPKFTLKLPASFGRAGRTMSECPLELSFSLCEETGCRKTKTEDIVQVNLQSELKHPQNMERHETLEKADEEKSEKEENMEVTCSVSVDGQEKQEFSFTLYDFDTKEKANKQDVEKIVVRSICEALGKTLKLPPSGSRTIKVKLAISPDSSKDLDANGLDAEAQKWPVDPLVIVEPAKHQDYDSSKSANTASTYLMSSSVDKPPSPYGHFCTSTSLPFTSSVAVQQNVLSAMPSPKLKPVRHNRLVSLQKQELKCGTNNHHKKTTDGNNCENRVPVNEVAKPPEEPVRCQNPQHLSSRVHVPESRERRNHYLDLAGIENDAPHRSDSLQKLYTASVNPSYLCPYKILDQSHICPKSHHLKDASSEFPFKKSPVHVKDSFGEAVVPNGYKTRMDPPNQDDLLNLNLDICDIVPDAKFDWERIYHRRSKSYDLHESGFHASASLYSPKLKPRQNHSGPFSPEGVRNTSPAHYRFRHRDKERQRAMQQVANWIAQEHVKDKEQERTHLLCKKIAKPSQNNTSCIDKHEHHHHHEHIHHHYHHFVEF